MTNMTLNYLVMDLHQILGSSLFYLSYLVTILPYSWTTLFIDGIDWVLLHTSAYCNHVQGKKKKFTVTNLIVGINGIEPTNYACSHRVLET